MLISVKMPTHVGVLTFIIMFNFVPSYFKMLGPKLKFYLFPVTQQTLKKGPIQTILFQFSVKNIIFKFH